MLVLLCFLTGLFCAEQKDLESVVSSVHGERVVFAGAVLKEHDVVVQYHAIDGKAYYVLWNFYGIMFDSVRSVERVFERASLRANEAGFFCTKDLHKLLKRSLGVCWGDKDRVRHDFPSQKLMPLCKKQIEQIFSVDQVLLWQFLPLRDSVAVDCEEVRLLCKGGTFRYRASLQESPSERSYNFSVVRSDPTDMIAKLEYCAQEETKRLEASIEKVGKTLSVQCVTSKGKNKGLKWDVSKVENDEGYSLLSFLVTCVLQGATPNSEGMIKNNTFFNDDICKIVQTCIPFGLDRPHTVTPLFGFSQLKKADLMKLPEVFSWTVVPADKRYFPCLKNSLALTLGNVTLEGIPHPPGDFRRGVLYPGTLLWGRDKDKLCYDPVWDEWSTKSMRWLAK